VCKPSCGALLNDTGHTDRGLGCCFNQGCKAGHWDGGSGSYDCGNHCCESFDSDIPSGTACASGMPSPPDTQTCSESWSDCGDGICTSGKSREYVIDCPDYDDTVCVYDAACPI
jgi:hypothetical protein